MYLLLRTPRETILRVFRAKPFSVHSVRKKLRVLRVFSVHSVRKKLRVLRVFSVYSVRKKLRVFFVHSVRKRSQ